jgi:NAD(P)-dependent dehydrogenase (short-subunit alcohol dehydrogenase family)
MSPVALIFGAGPGVGHHVSQAFRGKGYKVGIASRSLKAENSTADELHIPTDCSDPDAIVRAFDQVRAKYGHPSVVVYNGR